MGPSTPRLSFVCAQKRALMAGVGGGGGEKERGLGTHGTVICVHASVVNTPTRAEIEFRQTAM